ncbi:hypothetical protein [uncultured Sphingomonas sp.]|uniref:spike base protein, RCAP_Rcc01079 family n=1 Tax=uncultured Sphingomonas sp. TaxID=158754 RepID=UPI0035CA11C1
MSIDRFQDTLDSAALAARAPYAVTPNDVAPLPVIPKALYVGTVGHVMVRGIDGSEDVLFRNVASGQILDVRARFVRATGTTASDIVALA